MEIMNQTRKVAMCSFQDEATAKFAWCIPSLNKTPKRPSALPKIWAGRTRQVASRESRLFTFPRFPLATLGFWGVRPPLTWHSEVLFDVIPPPVTSERAARYFVF